MLYHENHNITVGIFEESIKKIADVIDEGVLVSVLEIFIIILASILTIREFIQLVIFKIKYFWSFDNFLEVSILVLTWYMLFGKNAGYYQRGIMSWLLLCMTVGLFLLLEKMYLFKVSIYVSMIRKITYDYVKLLFYLLFPVVAFGISFYFCIVTKKDDEQPFRKDESKDFAIVNKSTSFAETFVEAGIKTLIMSTGEFNFSDMVIENRSIFILFAAFVFLVFLVGMNLLNGMAISDIQDIKKDASKYQVVNQVENLIIYNKLKQIFNWSICDEILEKHQNFEYCFEDKIVKLNPNKNVSAGGGTYVKCSVHKTQTIKQKVSMLINGITWFNSQQKNKQGHKDLRECEEGKTSIQEKEQHNPIVQNQQERISGHKYLISSEYISSVKQIIKNNTRKEKRRKIEKRIGNRSSNDNDVILTLDALLELISQ